MTDPENKKEKEVYGVISDQFKVDWPFRMKKLVEYQANQMQIFSFMYPDHGTLT
jgi:hypothetical protein